MTDKSLARPVELTPGHWQPSFDAGRCANCGQSALPASPLFCSEVCSQTAKLVRYARRKVLDGTVDRPDIAEAIQIRLALILGGGYPAKARTIPTWFGGLSLIETPSHVSYVAHLQRRSTIQPVVQTISVTFGSYAAPATWGWHRRTLCRRDRSKVVLQTRFGGGSRRRDLCNCAMTR
jgi:hypothetical protein